ncbi:UDP-glucosyl transferase 88A1, putative [Theobroma cacao]|uniref:UDP-glucosyl transferase 88A1, putative n=1 Tax=Theobroma cacao TaxID=3641 RepID=A0A061EMM6_THECC|nr:UDP-glucosyl transferase 88A1, putative [Theobroma cacao]
MSIFQGSETSQPHIALFPSAGMGHLTPFLRLASMLLSHNCMVTLITTKSTVSVAESTYISFFLSTHPEIKHIEFQVPPMQPSNTTTDDPFFIQFKATNRSAHLIHPLISSLSPPLSAIFSDLVVASGVSKVAVDLATLVSNTITLPDCKGILMNTFDCFEPETVEKTLSAINNKRALRNLPLILPIGPLGTYELEKDQGQYLPWLNSQPAESVVFVSFGSRTAMSKDQIKELRHGLQKSEYRFLWILKTKTVDKDDTEDLEDLLSCSFLERTKNKGMVLKEWVNQQDILAHPAVGGFVNHCGWNSVMEAAQRGIPMLAWPQHGDQKANAEVLEKAGLGIWNRTWGWGGQRLVKTDGNQKRISELMTDVKLKSRAKKVGEEARQATGNGGSSIKTTMEVLLKEKQKIEWDIVEAGIFLTSPNVLSLIGISGTV